MTSQQNEIDRKMQDHTNELTKGVTENLGTWSKTLILIGWDHLKTVLDFWLNLNFIELMISKKIMDEKFKNGMGDFKLIRG